MDVIILGSGNTATVLGKLLVSKGYNIQQVWSRQYNHAQQLASQLDALAISSLQDISNRADLCIMAVADSAIGEVAHQLKLKKKILVHTAGSVSMHILQNSSPNYGVLYPLQSLRKEMAMLPDIPFLIDGNSSEVTEILLELAETLSDRAEQANDEQRMQMHLAAVLVSNFTNHLYAHAETFCKDHQLNFHLLQPMITEVAARLTEISPFKLQTGPARRNDLATVEKHIALLSGNPQLQLLYKTLSDSIWQMYHKKQELR